jgi:hypothetical protein
METKARSGSGSSSSTKRVRFREADPEVREYELVPWEKQGMPRMQPGHTRRYWQEVIEPDRQKLREQAQREKAQAAKEGREWKPQGGTLRIRTRSRGVAPPRDPDA